jgi:hypothetical protein
MSGLPPGSGPPPAQSCASGWRLRVASLSPSGRRAAPRRSRRGSHRPAVGATSALDSADGTVVTSSRSGGAPLVGAEPGRITILNVSLHKSGRCAPSRPRQDSGGVPRGQVANRLKARPATLVGSVAGSPPCSTPSSPGQGSSSAVGPSSPGAAPTPRPHETTGPPRDAATPTATAHPATRPTPRTASTARLPSPGQSRAGTTDRRGRDRALGTTRTETRRCGQPAEPPVPHRPPQRKFDFPLILLRRSPPWKRCVNATAWPVRSCGLRVLSR